MTDAITVTKLRKEYPPEKKGGVPFLAVNSISFSLKKGEILGLLGPNGAGKSTTIAMLLGVLTPTSGNIMYDGKNFPDHRSEILQSTTFASSYIKMPWRLSIIENLTVYGLMYGLKKNEVLQRIKKFLVFFDVWSQKDKTIDQLSAGQITRISFFTP